MARGKHNFQSILPRFFSRISFLIWMVGDIDFMSKLNMENDFFKRNASFRFKQIALL